jgi:hypothetical protein
MIQCRLSQKLVPYLIIEGADFTNVRDLSVARVEVSESRFPLKEEWILLGATAEPFHNGAWRIRQLKGTTIALVEQVPLRTRLSLCNRLHLTPYTCT